MAQMQIVGGTFQPPSGCVTNDSVSATAAIAVGKVVHLVPKFTTFGFDFDDTPTTKEFIVHVSKIAGTIRNFRVGLRDTGSSTSVAFDLRKYNAGNTSGVSVLSGTVTLTHGTTDRALQTGTISSPTTVADDWFTILMTVSSATGAVGPYAEVEFEEAAV
jgi:hypothetical protein